MSADGSGIPRLEVETGDGGTLVAERLRDGTVALRAGAGGALLDARAALALAGWLAPVVEENWLATIRDRLPEQLRTAADLYGDDPRGPRRLALEMLDEVPPRLLARALILLANAIGPDARERLVEALNRTGDPSRDALLRRRLGEERDAFAYLVAAAALWDALDPESPRFVDPTRG